MTTDSTINEAAQLVAAYLDHRGDPKGLAEFLILEPAEVGLDSMRARQAKYEEFYSGGKPEWIPEGQPAVKWEGECERHAVHGAFLADEALMAAAVDLLPAEAREYAERLVDFGRRPFAIGVEHVGEFRCDMTGEYGEGLAVVVRCRYDEPDCRTTIEHRDGVLRFSVDAVREALAGVLTA